MRTLRSSLLAAAALFIAGCGVDRDKLVGAWELESGPDQMVAGTIWEFKPDGKLITYLPTGANQRTEQSYDVSGSILTLKKKRIDEDGKEKEATGKGRIKVLNDNQLILKDDAEPKELVFRRKK